MSPGLFASPSGRFSELGTTPITLIGSSSSAQAARVPSTLAPPHMSYFISSIAAAGLIEIPPASNVSPLPTSATGLAPGLPPEYSMTMSFAGCRLPRDTDSRAPMPSFCICASDSTVVLSLALPRANACACSAR